MLKSTLDRMREAHAAELEGEEAAEAGFTLIELMVVLLIIAILLAIAIPTFLGVTNSANNRAAQSNLTNGLTEAASQYQNNNQAYGTSIGPILSASAPEFTWGLSADCKLVSATPNCVSYFPVDVASSGDQQGIILATWSKGTSTCWYAVEMAATPGSGGGSGFSAAGGATVGGTWYRQDNTPTICSAAASQTGKHWSTSYSSAPTN